MSQLMRLRYLSHRRPAKAQASLRIRTVSPEPSLFAHMKNESRQWVRPKIRHIAPLGGWACAFEEWRTKSTIISWHGSNMVLLESNTSKRWQTEWQTATVNVDPDENLAPDLSFWKLGIIMVDKLSHVTRKPVFGISDQVRLKLACSVTETG